MSAPIGPVVARRLRNQAEQVYLWGLDLDTAAKAGDWARVAQVSTAMAAEAGRIAARTQGATA